MQNKLVARKEIYTTLNNIDVVIVLEPLDANRMVCIVRGTKTYDTYISTIIKTAEHSYFHYTTLDPAFKKQKWASAVYNYLSKYWLDINGCELKDTTNFTSRYD